MTFPSKLMRGGNSLTSSSSGDPLTRLDVAFSKMLNDSESRKMIYYFTSGMRPVYYNETCTPMNKGGEGRQISNITFEVQMQTF